MNRRDFARISAMSAGATAACGFATAKEPEVPGGKAGRIRIAQLGIGHAHAAERMKSLKRLSEEFEIVGVAEEAKSTREISRGRESKVYDGLRRMTESELLDIPGLQAVMVETANLELVPASLRCMERGLAICMDKPGGEDLEAYARLLDGCRAKKLPFQIAYMLRNNPAIRFIRTAVRDGWLGDVHEIQASMGHDYGSEAYRRYLSAYPGGIMFLLGCHHIDWITAVLGRPEKVTPFMGSTKKMGGAGKNNCWAVLEYPHAIAAVHACDSEVGGQNNRRIKVCGSHGTIELSPIEQFNGSPLRLKMFLKEPAGTYAKGTHNVDLGIRTDRYVDQLKEFAAIVRGQIANPFTYEHDLLVQEILLSAAGNTQWH